MRLLLPLSDPRRFDHFVFNTFHPLHDFGERAINRADQGHTKASKRRTPAAPARAEHKLGRAREATTGWKMAFIVIVDDQMDSCRPLMLLMKHIGHRAICLTSGEAALAYLRTQRPDLMILDVMMPGMDGIEVLRFIRDDPQTRHLTVVMFSAISDPV